MLQIRKTKKERREGRCRMDILPLFFPLIQSIIRQEIYGKDIENNFFGAGIQKEILGRFLKEDIA